MNKAVVTNKFSSLPLFQAVFSAALFGAAAPFSKILLHSIGTFHLAGLLYLGAALGIAPAAVKSKTFSEIKCLNGKNKFRLTGAIIFGGVLAPIFLLIGLKLASASSVSMWLTLELVATAALGRLFFKEHLGFLGGLGLAGVLAAGILLGFGEQAAGARAGIYLGLACFCWGIDNNLTSLIDGITPSQITFWKSLIAGLINFAIGMVFGGFNIGWKIFGLSLFAGALFYGLSIMLYVSAAQHIGPTRGQMVFALAPVFGVLISVLILKENLGAIQIAAALLIAVSLVITFFDKHHHYHTHASLSHLHRHSHVDGHHDHEHIDVDDLDWHTHEHIHKSQGHAHSHLPDLHHRHDH